MSMEGIKKVAEVFTIMQQTQHALLQSATRRGEIDKQDIRLAHLMRKAKDAIKWEFIEITGEKK